MLKKPRALYKVILIFLMLLIMWGGFSKVDQIIHAQGQIVSSFHNQIVQVADGGVLYQLNVKEGDQVESGQVLAVLEKNHVQSAYNESLAKVSSLKLTLLRLKAEMNGKNFVVDKSIQINYPEMTDAAISIHQKRVRYINDQILILKDNVKVSDEELHLNLPLEESGDISRVDILRLKRALNDAKYQYSSTLNKYFQDISLELGKAEEDYATQQQNLIDRKQYLDHSDITSPINGVVKNIKVNTMGGVLKQGDELLQILPTNGDLVLDIKIKPSDIAKISSGLHAKVKLDAFDYSIFGMLNGVVSYVSPDALSEDTKNGPATYYKGIVIIKGRDFARGREQEIEIKPGMTASVDILTGERSVLSYLIKPISKVFGDSFGER